MTNNNNTQNNNEQQQSQQQSQSQQQQQQQKYRVTVRPEICLPGQIVCASTYDGNEYYVRVPENAQINDTFVFTISDNDKNNNNNKTNNNTTTKKNQSNNQSTNQNQNQQQVILTSILEKAPENLQQNDWKRLVFCGVNTKGLSLFGSGVDWKKRIAVLISGFGVAFIIGFVAALLITFPNEGGVWEKKQIKR